MPFALTSYFYQVLAGGQSNIKLSSSLCERIYADARTGNALKKLQTQFPHPDSHIKIQISAHIEI